MSIVRAGTLICLLLLAGCRAAPTDPAIETPKPELQPDPRPRKDSPHVAGEVIVAFREGVTEPQADAMLASHGLAWRSYFSRLFAYWVQVESGDPDLHAALLNRSPIVSWARRRGNPFGVHGAVYILVKFNVRATDETAQALIDSMPDLRVTTKLFPTQWGVAIVEPGTERRWIEVLEREPIVKYATLNGIIGVY